MSDNAFSESLYADLDISDEIKRAVADMGFVKLTPIQEQAIPALLTGRDVIGQAQTGTGKTAAFGLPILQMVDPSLRKLQAIVLCPTRELAVQATNEIRSFAKYMHNIKTLPVYGGQDIQVQIRGLRGVQVIVGTPGRVMDHMRRHTIKMDDVKVVVLDEADEMLNMGFREDMEVILGAIEHAHQTCLFSATMPKEILGITNQFQNDPLYIKITKKELTIDRIKQYYYPVKQEYKTIALCRLIKYHNYKRSIIFCNTKGMVDELAAYLTNEGYAAAGLHGDLTQKQRDSVMARFRNGTLGILIATDIAARGIDVDNVEAVFNYDVPQESEYYVHRIGRTGRSGREGVAHTLCRSKDFRKIRDIEFVCHTKMEEKKIPGIKEIKKAREMEALNGAKELLIELKERNADSGVFDKMSDLVRSYCEENEVTERELAAAFLAKELGSESVSEKDDGLEINLAEKSRKNRGARNSRNGDRIQGNSKDFGRRDFGNRDFRNKDNKSKDNKTKDAEGKIYFRKNTKLGDKFADKKGNDEKKKFFGKNNKSADRNTAGLNKDERRKVREKNKERSKRELGKAARETMHQNTKNRRKILDN